MATNPCQLQPSETFSYSRRSSKRNGSRRVVDRVLPTERGLKLVPAQESKTRSGVGRSQYALPLDPKISWCSSLRSQWCPWEDTITESFYGPLKIRISVLGEGAKSINDPQLAPDRGQPHLVSEEANTFRELLQQLSGLSQSLATEDPEPSPLLAFSKCRSMLAEIWSRRGSLPPGAEVTTDIDEALRVMWVAGARTVELVFTPTGDPHSYIYFSDIDAFGALPMTVANAVERLQWLDQGSASA